MPIHDDPSKLRSNVLPKDPLTAIAQSLARIASSVEVLPSLKSEMVQVRESLQLITDCVELGPVLTDGAAANTLKISLGDTLPGEFSDTLHQVYQRLNKAELLVARVESLEQLLQPKSPTPSNPITAEHRP